ncbi:hypothetical protein I4U23_000684, partial [Adineta vaga]
MTYQPANPLSFTTRSSSSSSNSNDDTENVSEHLSSSIPFIDASSSLDDSDSKTHGSHSLTRQISLSETDLLASIHRNQSDHEIPDDILFLDWDKERNLYQDYISSLRKEIRVLLQERAEYRTQKASFTDDQMKIDLLQKSLHEKNFVIEQLQTDSESLKEKNTNLIRKISTLESDTKSSINIIDELKQKITDLTIDLQNHILIKRRLDISIHNLESDCKIIDTERIKLTNEMKENQHNKQDLEKLLQKANVQIAEQDEQHQTQLTLTSNDEYNKLREDFDNITEEYKKLQEDNQAWLQYQQNQLLVLRDRLNLSDNDGNISFDDLLQQIEERFSNIKNECDTLANRVIELQAANINNNDKQRSDNRNEDEMQQNLAILTSQCTQLEEANRAWQQFQQTQLENFRVKLKHRFPLEDKISFDEIAEIIVNHVDPINRKDVAPLSEDASLHNLTLVQSAPSHDGERDEELRQLRDNLILLTAQCAQLDEANRAWPAYHQTQLQTLQNELQPYIPLSNEVTFDQLPQLIPLQKLYEDLQQESSTNLETIKQSYINTVNELTQELSALKEELDKRPAHDLTQQLTGNNQFIDGVLDQSKQTSNENGDEISVGNDWEDVGIDVPVSETPLDVLRNELGDCCLSVDYSGSFDDVVREVVNQIRNERKELNERYDALEKVNRDIRSESEANMESIRQSYTNTVNELNQELMAMQEQYEKLDAEKQSLNDQLENHSINDWNFGNQSVEKKASFEEILTSIDSLTKENILLKQNEDILRKDLENVREQLMNISTKCEQLQENNKQLLLEKQTLNSIAVDDDQWKADYVTLQKQCTELDIANRAWQLFHDNQMELLKNKFEDYFNFDQNENFEQIIEIVADKLDQQKQLNHSISSDVQINATNISNTSHLDSHGTESIMNLQEEIHSLEEQLKNSQLSIEMLTTNIQLITEENMLLKQQSSEIKYKNDFLIDHNTDLTNQVNALQQQQQQNVSPLSTTTRQSSIEEHSIHHITPVHSANNERDTEEIQQLQTDLARLTAQCGQLDEANRAWQQFHQNQIDFFRDKFHDWIQVDPNSTVDQIGQQILGYLNELNSGTSPITQSDRPSDSSVLLESLQKQLANYQYNESMLAQNLEQLNQKLLDVYKQCEEFRELNAQLIQSKQHVDKQLEEREKQIHELQQLINQKLDSTSEIDHYVGEKKETIHQNSADHIAPTSQYSETVETNQVPLFDSVAFDQQYQALQKLYEDLQQESSTNLETIKQSYINTVNELTQELSALKEELDKRPAHDLTQQLTGNNQFIDGVLDQSKQTSNENGDEISVGNDWEDVGVDVPVPETPLDILRNELGDCYLSVDYSGSFDDVVREVVNQIRNERKELNERYDALEKVNRDIRLESETNMEAIRESCLNTIKDLNEELLDVKERCTEINKRNKQLLIEIEDLNNQLNDRSIIVGHYSPLDINLLGQQNSMKPKEKFTLQLTGVSDTENLETNSLPNENHSSTIITVDKEIQTESLHQLWSMFDEENFPSDAAEDNDRLNDYMMEITSLSSTELADQLNKECQQILSKQNFQFTSSLDLELNQLSLLALHSLHNQHLTDDAKLLYNETVVRALKQEYELLNNEKNDLIEQITKNELEHLETKANLLNLIEENKRLKDEIIEMNRNSEEIKENRYEILEKEFHQLKQEFNELVNENELLKDYNAQMYQEKLQEKKDNDLVEIKSSCDIDTQCDLIDAAQQNNSKQSDWNNEAPPREQPSTDEEIVRLKTIVEEILHENEQLKDLNSELYESLNNRSNLSSTDNAIQCSLQTTFNENRLSEIHLVENNDWNDQSSPIEESTLFSITEGNLTKQTIDNETQTDDHQHDKLAQVNNKLKRALQTIKDKINRLVIEQPELFPNLTDDTLLRLDHLISAIEQLKDEKNRFEQSQFRDTEEIQNLKTQLTERREESKQKCADIEVNSAASDINDYKNQIEELIQERDQLRTRYEELSRTSEMIDNETQTDEQQKDKLVQVNNKLKRALQNVKDKIQRIINENPELFPDSSEDTMERLDQLATAVENQTVQIQFLQTERDQAQQMIAELQNTNQQSHNDEYSLQTKQSSSEDLPVDDYQKEIEQLRRNLSEKDEERSLLREHLNEIEIELRKTLDQQTVFEQERHAQAKENQHDIELLQQEIDQQNEELQNLSEKYLIQSELQNELNQQKEEMQERFAEQEKQISSFIEERTRLLLEVEKNTSAPAETADAEVQTDDHKIARFVSERPELFDGIGEETSERFDHLIATVENQATQVDILQANVNELQSAIQERLNEVEAELQKALDYHASTTDKYDSLENERITFVDESPDEIAQLKKSSENQHQDIQTDEDIHILDELIAQQSQEIQDLKATNATLLSQLESQVEKASSIQTIENETQTDDRQHEKLIQVNNKMKRALQGIKDKIHRLVSERPDLFDGVAEETSERLDHLIVTVDNQATEIDILRAQHEQLQNDMKEMQNFTETSEKEQILSSASLSSSLDDYQRRIDRLQDSLSQKDDERSVLHERLNEVQEELRKALDDHASLSATYESFVEQQAIDSEEKQNEIEQLRDELAQQKQIQRDEQEMIEQQNQELNDLKEINSSLPSQLESQTVESETQTDDRQHEKLTQVNNKLKRALQGFKDKIHRLVSERPDLFDGVAEETNERLDHLIATVDNQATQIDILRTEHEQVNENYHDRIKVLESELQARQDEVDNELRQKMEDSVTAVPITSLSIDDNSASLLEDHQKQIEQLRRNLSEKDEERSLLREHLNEIEIELRKSLNDYATLEQERETLLEKQKRHSEESENAIQQLRNELAQLKQLPDMENVQIQTDEDMKTRNELIEQQSEQMEALREENKILSSHLESQVETTDKQRKETEERMHNYKKQIHDLTEEREKLLEDIENKMSSAREMTHAEVQTDDRQHEKLAQMNNKLKRALQGFKDKIARFVSEQPELFDGIGEETSERLDHLIATVEHQATQINLMQTEHTDTEEQLRNNMKDLQSSLETSQNELDYERQTRVQQLSHSAPPDNNSSSMLDDYQRRIDRLQDSLSQKDNERSVLHERLNEVQEELRKAVDDHASLSATYESFVEQQALDSEEKQNEIEQLREQLAQQKQTQRDEQELQELIEQQCQELNDLKEINSSLSSQLESQVELTNEKKKIENQLHERNNQIENLIQERSKLLEEMESQRSGSAETIDNDTQTDEQLIEKPTQTNNKLKRALQGFRDKLNHLASDRPDLFDGIDALQTKHNLLDEQLRETLKELRTQGDQLLASASDAASSPNIEEYQKQIDQLQQTLIEKDDEHSSLVKRIDETEIELRKITEDVESIKNSYEEQIQSFIEERNTLLEHQARRFAECEHEIVELKANNDQLHEELAEAHHTPILHIITELYDLIEQQAGELKSLEEKCHTLSSQIDSNAILQFEAENYRNTLEQDLNNYKEQAKTLSEEIEKNRLSSVQTIDNESQTTDDQHEKLTKGHKKLKRTFDVFQDKIQQIVSKRPDLFEGINEESNERLDQLISIVENQTIQINDLQTERDQLISSSPSPSIIEDYQRKYDQLQQLLIENDAERTLLQERLDELSKTLTKYESMLEQQTLQSSSSDYENQPLKQSPEYQHVQVQTLEDIEMIDSEIQTDDYQFEKMKEVLSKFEEKILSVVEQRQDLFNGISDETNERLDQLISTLDNQAMYIDLLQIESKQIEEQLRNEIKELQNSLNACQYELNNERRIKVEQLVSASPVEDTSSSLIEDYQKQINQLQENLREKDQERSLLQERLHEVEIELRKTLDDHTSLLTKYQTIEQERDELSDQ